MGSNVKRLNFAIITKAIVNIFAEILHADRAAIDMKQINRDFSLKAWVRAPVVDLGDGAEAKIKLFHNMVMLHIKLKLATCTAYGSKYFVHRHTLDPGWGVKRSNHIFLLK